MPLMSAKDVQVHAQQALSDSPIHALRFLRVAHENETLRISGTLSSFYHKQLAQEVVKHAVQACEGAGPVEVVNAIHVQ